VIYIKEAHPTDGWAVPRNEQQGINIKDPKTYDERVKVAVKACSTLKIKLPCLVDGMDNAVNRAYSGWPDRLYIVDKDGKIAVKGGPGPGGFTPSVQEARRWLEQNAQ
jgi:hypothetical protein